MCQKSPSQAPFFHPVNTSKLINLSLPVAEESRESKLTEKNSQRETKEGGRKKHKKGKKDLQKTKLCIHLHYSQLTFASLQYQKTSNKLISRIQNPQISHQKTVCSYNSVSLLFSPLFSSSHNSHKMIKMFSTSSFINHPKNQ
jgi:hypothetical protein